MKKLLTFSSLVLLLFSTTLFSQTPVKSKTIEDGGTGPYKAVATGEATLPGHMVYRPADLNAASANGKLPVVLFGNGGCANSSAGHQNYLSEIASHGYIVLAIGPFPEEQQQPGPGAGRQPTSSKQLLEALDWITARNSDNTSIFFGKVNTSKVAVMGMSCGGLQAIEVSVDPRITTTVVLNSGVLSTPSPQGMSMPAVKKEDLNKYHNPVIYIIGGTKDIAYQNAMDDFSKIDKVPVVMANLEVGHGGTYTQPHGGAFAVTTLCWLDWQLKDKKEMAAKFLGDNCGLCNFEGWKIETKNFR